MVRCHLPVIASAGTWHQFCRVAWLEVNRYSIVCRRIFLNCLGCSVLLLVLLATGLGIVYFNVTRPLPGVSRTANRTPNTPPTPAERKQAEETVSRIAREFREPPQTERREADRFEVRISEAEANQILTSLPKVREALAKSRVSGLKLKFEPDVITVHARVPVWEEVLARVSASVRVWAENGKLAYETEAVRIGDFPAPQRIRQDLDKQLASQFQLLQRRFPGRVDEVKIESDRLEVSGTRK